MTRKDFELIAGILKAQRPFAQTDDERNLLNDTVKVFAERLKATNQQFNAERFIRACG